MFTFLLLWLTHSLSFVVVLAPFADLDPDIFEEERNEIVVHED